MWVSWTTDFWLRLFFPGLIQVVPGGIGRHGKTARKSLARGFRSMPPFSRRVDDVPHARGKRSEPFDVVRLLAAHDDPHFGEVSVIVAEIAGPVLHVRAVTADDVRMRAVLADR